MVAHVENGEASSGTTPDDIVGIVRSSAARSVSDLTISDEIGMATGGTGGRCSQEQRMAEEVANRRTSGSSRSSGTSIGSGRNRESGHDSGYGGYGSGSGGGDGSGTGRDDSGRGGGSINAAAEVEARDVEGEVDHTKATGENIESGHERNGDGEKHDGGGSPDSVSAEDETSAGEEVFPVRALSGKTLSDDGVCPTKY